MDINLSHGDAPKLRGLRKLMAMDGWRHEPSLLFYADGMDPDLRYFGGFNAMDPFLAFSVGHMKVAVAPIHELDKMLSESDFDEILSLPDLQQEAIRRFRLKQGSRPHESDLIRLIAERYRIRSFRVGNRFPAGLLVALQQVGIDVEVDRQPSFFAERQIKSAWEVEAIRKGNRASAAGFRVVAKTLAESKIRNGVLHHQGRVLTSERLRSLINQACFEHGANAVHTIAACADQACENHCLGHGPIRANELLVVDIFPQRMSDGYWGDMTRTYLKGKASDAQRRLVRTVKRAHEMALGMIKPGVTGGRVHEAIEAFFRREGYETQKTGAQPSGFFHALGHGVGLEIHEEPIMRAGAPFRFRRDMVVTVEPGLYYRGLGGCRIEDVVQVVAGGNRKISAAPYRWEIP